MKHYSKFLAISKDFSEVSDFGAPQWGPWVSLVKKNYNNSPVKKICNKHTLECNVASDFKQSAKNFRRFKILGAPKGPRDTFCLYIF